MAQKHRNIDEGIRLGEQNQCLLPDVKAWCQHIQIKSTSNGLLAQMTGLPIGLLRVSCPHGVSSSESMHLDWQAREFILENCINCPHHKEQAKDNFGRQVLEEKARQDLEAAEMLARRRDLAKQAYSNAETILTTRTASGIPSAITRESDGSGSGVK